MGGKKGGFLKGYTYWGGERRALPRVNEGKRGQSPAANFLGTGRGGNCNDGGRPRIWSEKLPMKNYGRVKEENWKRK